MGEVCLSSSPMLHRCFSELRLPLELIDSQIDEAPQSSYIVERPQRAGEAAEDGHEQLEVWVGWGTG